MKLEYTDGCICTSLTVDGKETAYMTPEEIKVSIRAMLDRGNRYSYSSGCMDVSY